MKREYFDDLAPRWDSLPGPPDSAARARRFVEDALPAGCSRVLDLGCGTGILVEALLASTAESIIECDFAERMLAQNRAKCADPRVRYLCCDANRPPLAEGALDAVLCFNVLPHLDDIPAALASLVAALRPGGRLAVGHMMDSASLNRLHETIGGPVGNDTLMPAHELAALLRSAGANVLVATETPDRYLVLAERG